MLTITTFSLRHRRNNGHFGGASIISPQWILTAAHSVPNTTNISNVVVVVGTNLLNSGGSSYNITTIIRHEGFDPDIHYINDIAVLRIAGNIVLTNLIKIICLTNKKLPEGSNVTYTGWGSKTAPYAAFANDLQYISLQSITVTQCRERLPGRPVYSTNLCTTSPVGQGPCGGDSGGPLVYNNGAQLRQVGILSYGIPCATGRPDVYTSIAAYRNWIRDNTGGV